MTGLCPQTLGVGREPGLGEAMADRGCRLKEPLLVMSGSSLLPPETDVELSKEKAEPWEVSAVPAMLDQETQGPCLPSETGA